MIEKLILDEEVFTFSSNIVYLGEEMKKFAKKLNEVIDAVNKKDTLYCSGIEERTGWNFNEEPWE